MDKIITDKEHIKSLAVEILPALEFFVANIKTYLFEDFPADQRHKIAILRDAINHYPNKDELKDVLKQSVHANGFRGILSKSFEKLGVSGLASNLENTLGKFNKMVLNNMEADYSHLPEFFKAVHVKEKIEEHRDIKFPIDKKLRGSNHKKESTKSTKAIETNKQKKQLNIS